jgi:hypothetical protein
MARRNLTLNPCVDCGTDKSDMTCPVNEPLDEIIDATPIRASRRTSTRSTPGWQEARSAIALTAAPAGARAASLVNVGRKFIVNGVVNDYRTCFDPITNIEGGPARPYGRARGEPWIVRSQVWAWPFYLQIPSYGCPFLGKPLPQANKDAQT